MIKKSLKSYSLANVYESIWFIMKTNISNGIDRFNWGISDSQPMAITSSLSSEINVLPDIIFKYIISIVIRQNEQSDAGEAETLMAELYSPYVLWTSKKKQ